MKVLHPAPFSDAILRYVANNDLLPPGVILDPFAGIGKVHQLADVTRTTVGIEIEPVWANAHPRTIQGNALALPFDDASFDGAFTSPVYGNRMSDHHNAKDGSTRRSYTHDLRRTLADPEAMLHPDNTGALYAWQSRYWHLHERAWAELLRVLKPGGRFILNVSDCFRTIKGERKRVPVVEGHLTTCRYLGFTLQDTHEVKTPRMQYGANDHRVEAEILLVLEKPNL